MGNEPFATAPRIFISYSPEETDFALWLSTALRGLGYEVWIGHENIVAGRSTIQTMQTALDRAEVMLLVVTPEALQSRVVNSQWTYFYCECEKHLIPLIRRMPGPSDKLNFMLAALQSIDFSSEAEDSDQTKASLARLHRALMESYGSRPNVGAELPMGFSTPLNSTDELGVREAGIVHVHHSMPTDLFMEWTRTTRHILRVMNTWTGLLARQPHHLLSALERGCGVQILLLNPSSPIARQRSRDLNLDTPDGGTDGPDVPRNIQTAIRQLADLFQEVEEFPGQLELRLFDLLPSFSLHQCDSHALIGFYPHASRTTTFPMLELQAESVLGRRFTKEFESVWQHALAIDLSTRYLPHRAGFDRPLDEPLSARELEILGLIEAGWSNQDIAQKLVVTLATVKKHINNLYSKLGVRSRTQAVLRAHQLHLISIPSPRTPPTNSPLDWRA